MIKTFIALVGRADSGKTTCLDKFVEQTNGVRYRKNGIDAKCLFNGKTVFVVTSSPQERFNKKTLENIEKYIVFFEKEANRMQLNEFVILMAFTKPRSPILVKERIDDTIIYIRGRYEDFKQIDMPKTKQEPTTNELNQKILAKIKEIEHCLI